MTAQGERTAPRSYYSDDIVTLLLGDSLAQLRTLGDESINCIVTSPPYFGLRNYEADGQYGLEQTPAEYVETMQSVFSEARRVLTNDGTLWLNLGDSYSGSWGNQGRGEPRPMKQQVHDGRYPNKGTHTGSIRPGQPPAKNLLGMPWRTAFALQDDGWILRNEIVWHKPNAMPESVQDRLSSRHEHLFMFSKQPQYWFDLDSVREPHKAPSRKAGARAFRARDLNHQRTATGSYEGPDSRGRNPGDVWEIATRPYPEAHFATFPIDLPLRCIKAGCRPGGTVLDPFSGSGTTGDAARRLGRKYVGIDLNASYHDLAVQRFAQGVLDFGPAA
ncbi:site-specific DNA-methyltransferase [Streptomyces sp. NPDC002809]|uniref:DNA-methyltransferase n=1 Tax=Streptomyces sp. NPDC002809 TaxID=3154433 RepID=UPI003333111A